MLKLDIPTRSCNFNRRMALGALACWFAVGSALASTDGRPEPEPERAVGGIPYEADELICGPSEAEWVDRFNCPMKPVEHDGLGHDVPDKRFVPNNPLVVPLKTMNCSGFILDFEDELNTTGTGFDDPGSGATRRATACQVFIDLASVINLGTSTPDILIREAEFDGQGPLASASPRIPGNANGCVGGSLHRHITTGIDPTPGAGVYDAEIRQVDLGPRVIGGTPVNVNDDWLVVPINDIDLYSVILHEATHALGFFSLIGPTGASPLASGAYSLYDEFLVDNGISSSKLLNNPCAFQAQASDLETDEVLYNTPATHNSLPQPVYSPMPFNSGRSLSHFDEVRSQLPYVMRWSTNGGADRLLTQPELDVLCDLGYNLFGTTCSNHWPIGVDDTNLTLNVTTPGNQICVNVLANDSDPDFDPLSIAPGSVLVANGGGSAMISGSDLCYTPSFGFCGTAVIRYQPEDGQREGNVTELWVDVQCSACPGDPCNLVCNGGFEDGIAAVPQIGGFTMFWPEPTAWPLPPCNSAATGWCGQRDSADLFIRGNAAANWDLPTNYFSGNATGGQVETHNGSPNDRYMGLMRKNHLGSNYEGIFAQTIQPLDGSGGTTYELDFWAFATPNCTNCTAIDGLLEVYLDDVAPIAPMMIPSNPSANALLLGNITIPRDQWTHFTLPPFTTNFNYEFLVIRAVDPAPTGSNTYTYVDDVALRELSAVNVDIIKWVDDPTPQLGQPITYTVAVCNLDTAPITNVTIQDVLPNGVTYASGFGNTYPQYTFPSIAGQTCNTVNLQATVDLSAPVNTPITNCAFLFSAGNMCTSLASNSQCTDIVIEATDVGVTKTVSNSSPLVGSVVTYTITVTNFGSIDATGVVVNDLLPGGVQYQAHSVGGGATYDNVSGDLTIPALPAGGSVTLDIDVLIGAGGCGAVNVATLTAINQTDLNLTNNQDSVAFAPCVASGGGSGLFVDSGQTLGNAASITVDLGDIDGDGDLDAVVGNFRQPTQVWENTGSGVFSSWQTLPAWEDVAVRLGDFDNDNNLDLFIADNTGPATVWPGTGVPLTPFSSTASQTLGGANSLDAALDDVDNDGDLDAVVANNGGNDVWINTTGLFSPGQSLGNVASWGMALGHLDNDGWPDAFFANASSGMNGVGDRVWWHLSSPNFSDSNQSLGSQASRKVELADLDGDGDLDAVVRSVPGQPNNAWENTGIGSAVFAQVGQTLGFAGNALDLGDVNGDGFDDAFFAHPGGNRVLTNDGVGNLTFTDSGQSLGSSNSRDVKLGDLDGDGDLDAFVVNYNQPNKVWFNEGSVFCITGTATGVGYTWQLLGNGVNLSQPNAPGVTAGGSSADLAAAFVASINALGGQSVTAAVTSGNSNCFTVSAVNSPSLQLFVGAAGGLPTCQVGAAGCTYNPTIRAGFPKPEPTASLEIVNPDLFGVTAVNEIEISWWAQNVSDRATLDLFYDTDADGRDGKLLSAGLPASQGATTWKTRGVTPGKYFVYGVLKGAAGEPVTAVSDGVVTVLRKVGVELTGKALARDLSDPP